jgi:uncharacterized protein (DUF58 family)
MKEIIINSRRKAFSLFAGHRHSTKHSEGIDFEELREYQIGDNVKRIDYNITAKKQKPYIKVFTQEKELNIVIVGIFDYRTFFGSQMLKSEKMLEIISTLAFSGVKSDDRITIKLFSKNDLFLKPTKSYKAILGSLTKFDEDVKTKLDYEKIYNSLLHLPKNSVLIIVSDFFEYSDVLKKLAKKYDTYSVIVRDKLEENPELLNGYNIIDPLTNQVKSANFDKSYKAKLLENDSNLFKLLKQSNVKFQKLYTNEDVLNLRRLFG